ncbi:MAG: protein kinase [Candidatus Wallbacteria bacterium]|nr:protein kinase [Candidatus Wallbacteria bacterium]
MADKNKKNLQDKTLIEDRTILESDRTLAGKTGDPGHKLSSFRDYSVLELLPAAGSEADIYKAAKNGEVRILKLYRFGNNPNLEALKKIHEISGKFPADVVRIFESDFDEELKRYYEIIEYLPLGSLRELFDMLRGNDRLLIDVIRCFNNGLRLLHSNNLLHLDLKPSNVMLRTLDPLKLVFTDYGVSSVIDDEISRKMTVNLKGTPIYWSPEAFTQIVGRESDFWSLGMIVLEILLGRHPLQGQDMRVIMYTLATKGIDVDQSLPDRYQLLLKGLLTRNPRKRWGYDQVARWLAGDSEIPVFFDFCQEIKGLQKPFGFREADYHSLEELLHAFVHDEDSWETAKIIIGHGYLEDWLKRNGEFDKCVIIEKLRKLSRNDLDFLLLKLTLTFLRGTGFVVFGKLISFQSVYQITTRALEGKCTPGETNVIKSVISGALLTYYTDYLTSIQRDPEGDEFCLLLRVMKFNVPKMLFEDSLNSLLEIFEFWWKPQEFIFPGNCGIKEKIAMLKNHGELLLRKTELEALSEKYYLPLEIMENLGASQPDVVVDYLRILQKLRQDDSLIEKAKIKESVFSVKKYVEIGKFRKNKIDLFLLSRLPLLSQHLFAVRFKTYEFKMLREYLEILKGCDLEWTRADKEAIDDLAESMEPRSYQTRKYFFACLNGLVFGWVFAMFGILYLDFLAGIKYYIPNPSSSSGMLVLGLGFLVGIVRSFEEPEGERLNEFVRWFLASSLVLFAFFLLMCRLIPWSGPYGAAAVGFLLGSFFYFIVSEYYTEIRVSRIYDKYLYRILAVRNQTTREVKNEIGKSA